MTHTSTSTPAVREAAMRVLGIDPGLADLGYGVLERSGPGRNIGWVAHGVISTPAGAPVALRLQTIYLRLTELIELHRPHEVAIESLFFASNVSTAMTVAQARGVAILASAQSGVPLGEYSPPQIKQAVTGSGKAAKRQVQLMVRAVLGLEEIPRPDHAADALAVALCHLHHAGAIVQARTRVRDESGREAMNANKALLAQQRRRRRA